jgi:hypothetical protein
MEWEHAVLKFSRRLAGAALRSLHQRGGAVGQEPWVAALQADLGIVQASSSPAPVCASEAKAGRPVSSSGKTRKSPARKAGAAAKGTGKGKKKAAAAGGGKKTGASRTTAARRSAGAKRPAAARGKASRSSSTRSKAD